VRPAAITPVEPLAPAAAPTQAGGSGSAAPVPGAARAPSAIYPNTMRAPARQRSLAEMANEQLNGGQPRRDKLAEGVSAAEKPDCIGPNSGGSLFGLITIPIAAAMDKCK
jgi:hypothetical protein